MANFLSLPEVPRKIAILGTTRTKISAPFDDPSWAIWACSPGNMDLPRIDAFFEIHPISEMDRDPEMQVYLAWLRRQKHLFLTELDRRWPNAKLLPVDVLLEEFGPYFWQSTISWMMGAAIMLKPEIIGIFGVNMSAQEEYGWQRLGCHHFIQLALDRDIQVTAPPESEILNPLPLYGLGNRSPQWKTLQRRKKELVDRTVYLDREMKRMGEELLANRGALENIQWMIDTFCGAVELPWTGSLADSHNDSPGGRDKEEEPDDAVRKIFHGERDAG